MTHIQTGQMQHLLQFSGICEILFFIFDELDELVNLHVDYLVYTVHSDGFQLMPKNSAIEGFIQQEFRSQHVCWVVAHLSLKGKQFKESFHKIYVSIVERSR